MKSHFLLLQCILEESGVRCCTSTTRDFKTVMGRVEHEGLSFLTIALPQFAKDLERALDEGKAAPSLWAGYAKRGCLPKLFRGFTSQVFDADSGVLLHEPSIEAVRCLRQVCNLFAKIELPCSDARMKAAFEKYVQCESDVKEQDSKELNWLDKTNLRRIFDLCFRQTLIQLDREIYLDELSPRHGPGAVAERLSSNGKWRSLLWTERLEEVFDPSVWLFPSVSHFLESEPLDIRDPGTEIPVRVITVPKTLKTPRIIAIEPTCMMFVQQALSRRLVDLLLTSDSVRQVVGFNDQVPNQELALKGSQDGTLATLDLSEASDRVSNQLVRFLFSPYPWVFKGLDVSRSRKADVPGFGVLRLAKYASMGSALCFPVEAMVFVTLVLYGIEKERGTTLGRRDLKDLVGQVRVFGDDIVAPSDCASSVAATLEAFGLRVNADKSFWTGRFRESCGKEYLNGQDVSYVKVRRMLPSSLRHAPEIISTVSLRNQLWERGWTQPVEMLDELLNSVLKGHYPVVLPTSQVLGRYSWDGQYDVSSSCPDRQIPLVKGFVVSSRPPSDPLEGPGALHKVFLSERLHHPIVKWFEEPTLAEDHLERAGRPRAVNIKLVKAPPY